MQSGVIFLKKQDFDLLILAQLNTITISQLHLIGLHGETLVSTRLALNRLAKKELVVKKPYLITIICIILHLRKRGVPS